MSFINDFLEYFKVDEINDKILVLNVLGIGMMITGKFDISEISETQVELKTKSENLLIVGENLQIKSLSKGEIYLSGNIVNFARSKVWYDWDKNIWFEPSKTYK